MGKVNNMRFNIADPVYEQELQVFVGDPNWFIKTMVRDIGDDMEEFLTDLGGSASCICVTDREGTLHDIIHLPAYKKDSPWWLGCLLHECVHHCLRVLGRVGVPVTPDSNEAFAYYYTMIVGRINTNITKRLKSLKKRNKNVKRK